MWKNITKRDFFQKSCRL